MNASIRNSNSKNWFKVLTMFIIMEFQNIYLQIDEHEN